MTDSTKQDDRQNGYLCDKKALVEGVRQGLKQWSSEEYEGGNALESLFLFRRRLYESSSHPRLVMNQLLLDTLQQLENKFSYDASLIRHRFLDGRSVRQLANQQNIAESSIFPQQRKAIERLTTELIEQDRQAYETQRVAMENRLEPLTYTNLVGVEEALAHLQTLVVRRTAPWLIIMEGIGGIGKTTLADALLRHLIDQRLVDDAAWVSAHQQQLDLVGNLHTKEKVALTANDLIEQLIDQFFPYGLQKQNAEERYIALYDRLKRVPCVVVVDNLETILDIETLLPTLQHLSNPTKFIITSRESLYGIPNLYHHEMDELNQQNALALIRHEAEIRGLPILAESSDEELMPIFATVGGSPLALRLVVGQVHLYPLRSILDDLREARSQSIENLYTYIYWKSWEKLTIPEQRALLAMPMTDPQGDDIEYIAEVGDLEVAELHQSLNRLVTLSLVNASGGIHHRRYRIHALTRTFLRQQVAKWLT